MKRKKIHSFNIFFKSVLLLFWNTEENSTRMARLVQDLFPCFRGRKKLGRAEGREEGSFLRGGRVGGPNI